MADRRPRTAVLPIAAGGAAPRVPAEQIIAAVARYCEVTPDEIKGHMRLRQFTWARHLAMWMVRGLSGASYPAIGRRFGGRDHGTVMHACRRVDERLGRRDPRAVWLEIRGVAVTVEDEDDG